MNPDPTNIPNTVSAVFGLGNEACAYERWGKAEPFLPGGQLSGHTHTRA